MTMAERAIEVYINLNITLLVAYSIWLALQAFLRLGSFRHAYALQHSVLKTLLLLVAASPVLAILVTRMIDVLSPGSSVAVSDIVVASFLRGELGSDAVLLESVLNTRSIWTDGLLTVNSPVFLSLSIALVIGALWAALRIAVSAWRLHQVLNNSHFWRRFGSVDLHLSDTVIVPFAARGLFRRHVVLPVDLLADRDARRMALAHEIQHLRQGDLEWQLGFELVRPFFFWNPAFVLLRYQFDRLRELSCDQAVIAQRKFMPLDYARCLLSFCERSIGKRQQHMLNVALVATSGRSARAELANRLTSLKSMGPRTNFVFWKSVALALPLAITISAVGASLQPPKDWSLDRLTLSTVINLERFAKIERGY